MISFGALFTSDDPRWGQATEVRVRSNEDGTWIVDWMYIIGSGPTLAAAQAAFVEACVAEFRKLKFLAVMANSARGRVLCPPVSGGDQQEAFRRLYYSLSREFCEAEMEAYEDEWRRNR